MDNSNNPNRDEWIAGWRAWCRFGLPDGQSPAWVAGYDAADRANNAGGMRPVAAEAEGEYERLCAVQVAS